MVLDGMSLYQNPVNAGVPQSSILCYKPFLLYINGLPDDAILTIAICADDTTLHSKWDKPCDLWQKLGSGF